MSFAHRNMTRRGVALAGLGALTLLLVTALADVVTKVGYKADGTAHEGLVPIEGKTYLYEGGVKYKGGRKEYRGLRYFWPNDGRMATDEDVE